MATGVASVIGAHLIADERHSAIVGPGEVGDWRAAVVDQLDAPAALVLDPDEDDAGAVAGRQLLVRLVPPHQHNLPDGYGGSFRGLSVSGLCG